MIRVVVEIEEDAVAALAAVFAEMEGMTAMGCSAEYASCSSAKRDDSRGPAVRLGRRAGGTCISLAPGTRGRRMPGLAVPGPGNEKVGRSQCATGLDPFRTATTSLSLRDRGELGTPGAGELIRWNYESSPFPIRTQTRRLFGPKRRTFASYFLPFSMRRSPCAFQASRMGAGS